MVIDIFVALFMNKVFLAGFLAWFISQLSKVVILAYSEKTISPKMLIRRASMPSSHAATVSALTTAILLTEGITSLSVAVFFFSLIVIRDVLDINIGMPDRGRIGLNLKTYIHTPLEVIIGILVGVLVSVIVI